MSKKMKCMEVRDNEGNLILRLFYTIEEIQMEEDKSSSSKSKAKKEKDQSDSSKSNDDLMTDAQKRYLFRILAGKGLEQEEAHEQLKEFFQVDSLKDVTKVEASQMIERLLEETKGEKDDRPPF